MVRDEVPG